MKLKLKFRLYEFLKKSVIDHTLKSSKKKKKKKHKKKSSDSDSSSDSGSESEDEWVEKKQPTDVAPKDESKSPPPPQRPEREDWLGVLSGSSVVSNKDVRGNREEQKRQQRQKAEEEAAAQQVWSLTHVFFCWLILKGIQTLTKENLM